MSEEADPNNAEEEADEATPPPAERTGCLTSLIPVTTPGCAAWLTAVFLVATVITVWVVFWMDPSNVPWRHSFSWLRIAAIIGLMITIPWVVYKTIRLWLEGTPGAFPDLDYAWRAGLHALASNELDIASVPIFLITGSSGETQEKALMSATGLRFSVEGVPQGPAPIHWYANSEAIYLFCTDASWTSALASLREEIALEAAASGLAPESPPTFRTIEISQPPQPENQPTSLASSAIPPAAAPGGSQDFRGTIVWNESSGPASAVAQPTAQPAAPEPGEGGLRGTLIFNEGTGRNVEAPPPPPTTDSSRGSYSTSQFAEQRTPRKPVLVSHQYSSSCLQELQHLGQLLRRARQPLCTMNGILAMIQFESIHSTPAELEEFQKALRADMETIQYAFQMRVPVSALVVGLEKERGFRELVLRVGKERAFSQRFGRRFDVHALPSKEELVGLTTHLCGVFEDWAYSLFREEQSLTRPGNTRLYELLSTVRCEWKNRLSEILAGGFGCEATKTAGETSMLFSGCYFAATGETPDRQAFVKGVVDKLGEEQELIEWTTEALRANRIQNVAANLGMFVTIGLLISLLLMYLLFGS